MVVVAVVEEKDWRFGYLFLLWTGGGGGGGGGCGKKIGDLVFFFLL